MINFNFSQDIYRDRVENWLKEEVYNVADKLHTAADRSAQQIVTLSWILTSDTELCKN